MVDFDMHLAEARVSHSVIAMLTDFGLVDGYVGVMKGVILSLAPRAVIVDVTHDLPPQAIQAGAFLLRWSYGYFPSGTIHLSIVDPGVGTERGILAMQTSGHFFLAPDNGLLWPVWEEALALGESPKLLEVTNKSLWMDRVSPTFHGRDIFSPVAAHLASGVAFEELGTSIDVPRMQMSLPVPVRRGNLWQGEILYIDRFGNLITNFERLHLERWLQETGYKHTDIQVIVRDRAIGSLGGSYGTAQPGEFVVTYDGFDTIEIAVNQGSARDVLECGIGEPVRLEVR